MNENEQKINQESDNEIIKQQKQEIPSEISESEIEEIAKNFSEDQKISENFSCTKEKLSEAIKKATAEILSTAKNEIDKGHLEYLIENSLLNISQSFDKRDNQYVHGTGTDALFNILKEGNIKIRGNEFGGADVEMGHKTDGSYISVSENTSMGKSLSYFYSRGFENASTRGFQINADVINGSNAVLEQWDALTEEEKNKLEKEYNFSREGLESIEKRSLYFNPNTEKQKIEIYKMVINALENNRIPNISDNIGTDGEIQHLIGPGTNNEPAYNKIFAKIKEEIKRYPNTPINKFIDEYNELFLRTKNRLDEFTKLPVEEQNQKVNQFPVVITLEKNKINSDISTTRILEDGREVPIHPSEQEVRIFGSVDLSAISEIQIPEELISKVQIIISEEIKKSNDPETKKHLESIKIIPMEFYEVERIIQNKINDLK